MQSLKELVKIRALMFVRTLLVTAQLVLQVVSNVVSYACIAVSWQA